MLKEHEVKQTTPEEFEKIIEVATDWEVKTNCIRSDLPLFLICHTSNTEDRLEKIKIVLETGKKRKQSEPDWEKRVNMCLSYAAGKLDITLLKLLIENGADINYAGEFDRTFVIEILESIAYFSGSEKAWEDFFSCLHQSIEQGADLNVVCKKYRFYEEEMDIIDVIEKTGYKRKLYDFFTPYKDHFNDEKRKKFEAYKLKSLF